MRWQNGGGTTWLVICLALLVAAGCSPRRSTGETDPGTGTVDSEATPSVTSEPVELAMSSTGFVNGTRMPARYAGESAPDGRNVSPAVLWTGGTPQVSSYALVMVDRHPIADNWVHWMVVDMPANTAALPENASGPVMPPGARELTNTYGRVGYGGPTPPRGSGDHTYEITVYGLSVDRLDIAQGATLEQFEEAVRPVTIARGTLTGTFSQ